MRAKVPPVRTKWFLVDVQCARCVFDDKGAGGAGGSARELAGLSPETYRERDSPLVATRPRWLVAYRLRPPALFLLT